MNEPVVLEGLRVWDGLADTYLPGVDAVRIEAGRIDDVGSAQRVGEGARRVPCAGVTLLPGLIDAHVHLCLDPAITDALAHGNVPRETRRAAMAARAEAMVRAGITTARDLGGGDHDVFELRDRILANELPGPRLLCAGQPITSVKGHCWFWGGEAANEAEALAVLDRQVQAGADLVKVMATGGNLTPGSTPADSQFDAATLRAIVERATAAQRHVAAHCHGTDGIRNAVFAGVRTIEHCSWVGPDGWGKHFDAEAVAEMATRGTFVSPTANAGWRRNIGRVEYEARLRANFDRMRAAGVTLIASTDAGIPGVLHHQLPLALPVFAHFAGLTPVQVLRAATSDCAAGVGIGDVTGRVVPGYSADLLLVHGDPLTNLDALQQPAQVWARGHRVL